MSLAKYLLKDYITHYIHDLVIFIHSIQLNKDLRSLAEGKLDQEVFPGDMGMHSIVMTIHGA
jgi:hypothetical protein